MLNFDHPFFGNGATCSTLISVVSGQWVDVKPGFDVLSLLDELYSAGMGDVSWDTPLMRLSKHMRLRGIGLLALDMSSGLPICDLFTSDDTSWSSQFQSEYQETYYQHDPTAGVVTDWCAGRWFDDRSHISPVRLTKGVFHQEYLASHKVGGFCGFFIQKNAQRGDYLSLLCDTGQSSPEPAQRQVLEVLRTHMARALQLQSRLLPLEQQAGINEAALNALELPLFILDENRTLLQTNVAGQELMKANPALRCIGGRLIPEGYSDAAQWRQACTRGVLLLRAKNGQSLPLTLYPMPAATRMGRHWQRPLTLMLGPGMPSPDLRMRQLRALYGLTQAEAELCVLLAFESLSQQDCAEQRQVSLNTIRTQIKSIEAKLGVNSMAQVARLAFLQYSKPSL